MQVKNFLEHFPFNRDSLYLYMKLVYVYMK